MLKATISLYVFQRVLNTVLPVMQIQFQPVCYSSFYPLLLIEFLRVYYCSQFPKILEEFLIASICSLFVAVTHFRRSWQPGFPLTHSSRGRILWRNWEKILKNFPPCYLHSVTSTNGFYSPHPPLSKSGLKLVCNVNIVYGPETSTKLYVQEFGLSTFSNKSGTSENTCLYIIFILPCSFSRKKVMRSKIGKGRVSFLGPEVRS